MTGRAFIAVTDDAGVLLSWRSYGDTSEVFQVEKNGQALTSGKDYGSGIKLIRIRKK